MARTLVESIGYMLGQKAMQAKSVFELLGGTEEESLRAEVRLGHDLAAAVLERTPLVEENELTRFAARIGRWLSGRVKERKVPFRFLVTADAQLNGYALPGGPVFISWPLLVLCGGERDEIAFVLAHEMGHVVRRHALDRIVKDAALSVLLRQWSGRQAASVWLGKVGQQVLGSAFSREDELEADAFAVDLVRAAGGDGSAGERLLEKIGRIAGQSGRFGSPYFSTHPPLAERVGHLRNRFSRVG